MKQNTFEVFKAIKRVVKFAIIQAMQRYPGGCVSTEKENNKLFEKRTE